MLTAIPAGPRPPRQVTAAAVLLYCAGGVYVLSAGLSVAGPAAGLSVQVLWAAAVFQLGLAALFGLSAYHARAGRAGARTGVYVLACLSVCGLCARVLSTGGTTDVSDTAAQGSSANWHNGSTVVAIVFVLSVLTAVTLLSLPSANRYFREITRAQASRFGVRPADPGPW